MRAYLLITIMAVKFVHVLKRIEEINRDISELQEMMSNLQSNRQYRDSVKIALEAQVNTLLGERVKLMELKIENPPPNFVEEQNVYEKELKARPSYDLDDLKGGTIITSTMRTTNFKFNDVNSNSRKAVAAKSETTSVREPVKKAPASTISRADILKDLPPLEY